MWCSESKTCILVCLKFIDIRSSQMHSLFTLESECAIDWASCISIAICVNVSDNILHV